MTLRQLLSERAAEVLRPIEQLHGRKIGDTELIDGVRALLSNEDYVYNTTAHADAVLDRVLYLKGLVAERRGTINISCTPEGNTALHVACKTVPPRPESMGDAVWLAEANFRRLFRVRNDLVKILIEAGANPFLANDEGATCIDVAPEGPPRESLVAYLHELRGLTEPSVLSVPPLDASRLMKRSHGDSGHATFSHIARHCVYYLYKGGVYLWDVVKDTEHIVYQPRESDPMITSLEERFAGYERRKSLAVTGHNVGGGRWTSSKKGGAAAAAEAAAAMQRPSFDAEEGDDILKKIALLEAKVALVGNFVVTTGIDVHRSGAIPREGVMEWVICNTGAVIGVRLNADGPCLRRGGGGGGAAMRGSGSGGAASPARRQSHVCGSAADYPEGMTIDTNIFQNCAIRFSRRANASHICCAIDGLRRKLAYVVAVKRGGAGGYGAILPKATDTFCGFANDWDGGAGTNSSAGTTPARGSFAVPSINARRESGPFGGPSGGGGGGRVNFAPNPISSAGGHLNASSTGPTSVSGNKRVSFAQPPQEPFVPACGGGSNAATHLRKTSDASSDGRPFAPSYDSSADSSAAAGGNAAGGKGGDFAKVFAPEEHGAVFRVCNLRPRRGGHPKENLEDVVDDLCNAHEDPFGNGVIEHVDFRIPPHYGDAVCVTQCGEDIFILFCVRGVIVADATECVGRPVAAFHDITSLIHLPDDVFIHNGASTAPQRFRPVKVDERLARRMFVVQTDEVELLSLERRASDSAILIEPMMRVPKDVQTPHSYTPFFHGARDELILVYQSARKTLVTSYDFNRRTFESLCKLPKPSSLRFFPAGKDAAEAGGAARELPQSVFAVGVDAPFLLRYNVTMHVMSVYSWDEVLQKRDAKKISLVPALFSREPRPMVKKGRLVELITKYASPAQVFTEVPCAWLVVECQTLQQLVKDGGLLARDKIGGFSFSPDVTLTDNINAVLSNAFAKVAPGAGGRVVAYQPPPFAYMPSEDEALDGDEVALLEEDYFASRPRHEGVWCAYFPDIGDALRASLQLHRYLSKDAPWPADVLALAGAAEVRRPYQIKSDVEKRHANVLADRDETPFDERGPRIRSLVVNATTTTPITQLLKAHRMATDTTAQFPIPGEPKYRPVAHDGVTVVPAKAMGVLEPMLPIVTVTTPQTRRLSPVEPYEGGDKDAGRGTVFAAVEKNLVIVTPFELRSRLAEH